MEYRVAELQKHQIFALTMLQLQTLRKIQEEETDSEKTDDVLEGRLGMVGVGRSQLGF